MRDPNYPFADILRQVAGLLARSADSGERVNPPWTNATVKRAKPWDSYRQVATQTASPARLVLMLYDGAICFLELAQTGFDCTDPTQLNQAVDNNIVRAQAIIYEMNATLNMEAGGEVAATFRRLYTFHTRLREANFKKHRAVPGHPAAPARPAR